MSLQRQGLEGRTGEIEFGDAVSEVHTGHTQAGLGAQWANQVMVPGEDGLENEEVDLSE